MRIVGIGITVVLLLCGSSFPAVTASSPPAERAGESSCGREMAASAEVPRKWGELMSHVASNMEAHATWVGTGSKPAQREHEALLRVAREYRAMAAASARAANAMEAMKSLEPAPHDPRQMDRAAQARWMRAKIQMQRDFAALLTRHADDSERALAFLERSIGAPPSGEAMSGRN
jgi:hypothetical protein